MIDFHSDMALSSSLQPVRAVLKESVSACYSLVLDLFAENALPDPTAALNKNASVRFRVLDAAGDVKSRIISGVIVEMSLAGVIQAFSEAAKYWYQLVLVPHLALLDHSQRSRVFCTERPRPIDNVIEEILQTPIDVAPLAIDYESHLSKNNQSKSIYPDRDMIVQYQESDFAFLSRLAEQSGIFYFFAEDHGREKLIFADVNHAFPWLDGAEDDATLSYQPHGRHDRGRAVRSATLKTHLTTNGVELDEWFYKTPKTALVASAVGDSDGVGLLQLRGSEGYQDATWGERLARMRLDESNVDKVVLEGRTDCVSLAAGRVFKLKDHPVPNMNTSYIVVSAEHHAWVSVTGIEHLPGPEPRGAEYWNEFTAIPSTTTFRPRRRTPRPNVPGVMRAVVDGVDTKRANIDEFGCYRIRFPFDTEQRNAGQASCPVRLITPYGGQNEGFHFPLRATSMVMIAFENGDPDRPIIVGPLYDARQSSVVTSANRTANVISTVTGIKMIMNDGKAA